MPLTPPSVGKATPRGVVDSGKRSFFNFSLVFVIGHLTRDSYRNPPTVYRNPPTVCCNGVPQPPNGVPQRCTAPPQRCTATVYCNGVPQRCTATPQRCAATPQRCPEAWGNGVPQPPNGVPQPPRRTDAGQYELDLLAPLAPWGSGFCMPCTARTSLWNSVRIFGAPQRAQGGPK